METSGYMQAGNTNRFAAEYAAKTFKDQADCAINNNPLPSETVSQITEEAISGMQSLCNGLQSIADRISGSIPQIVKAENPDRIEPSIKDRTRTMRGLVYLANELSARIAQNLL